MLLEPESRATLVGGRDVQLSKEHTFLSLCFSSSTALHPSHSAWWCVDLKLAELCQWPPSEYVLVYWWMQGKSWDLYSYKSTSIQLFSGKGSEEKNGKKYGLLPNPGGGSARVVKKPNCFFEKSIFQRVSRIILGPPKHVLHLVWSAFVISTAIRTALKVAQVARILGKRRPVLKMKFNCS